jgi:cytochrome P450
MPADGPHTVKSSRDARQCPSFKESRMLADAQLANGCPVHKGRDDRKTADTVDDGLKPFPGSRIARTFAFARDILRSTEMRQGGGAADKIVLDNPEHISFFFLDGELHKRRRASVAGYFTPKTIVNRYHPLMQTVMDREIAKFQSNGSAVLDEMSLELASEITMEILGLTNSDQHAMTRRIKAMMNNHKSFDKRWWYRFLHDVLLGWYHKGFGAWMAYQFYTKDLLPAAEARRKEPKDDVMSYMVKENYSKKAMIIECMTYAAAGVSTTREFMIMAAWQLFDHPDLMEKFLKGDEADQFAILEEILRLDPIAGYLYRRSVNDVPETAGGPVEKGELLAINIRAANQDEAVVGECPFQLDPERAKRQKVVGAYMSFGDGPHRCPGSQVALHESRIFLDRLLRVPGIKLKTPPNIGWSMSTQGYELRGAIVTCDRV